MSRTATRARCPVCGEPPTHDARPFCSRRCADVDLHRWLTGQYRVPVVEEDGGTDEGAPGLDDDREGGGGPSNH